MPADDVASEAEPVQEELLDTGGLQRSIEAVLFVASEALSIKTLAKLTGAEESEVTVALQRIDEEFAGRGERLGGRILIFLTGADVLAAVDALGLIGASRDRDADADLDFGIDHAGFRAVDRDSGV